MEDDDEFGDLYADVLPTVTPASPPQQPSPSPPPPQIDLNNSIASDNEEILHSSKPEDRHVSPDNDSDDNFGIEDTGDEIPGLFPSEVRVSGGGVDNWDDDSDSEDDLEIVLNNDVNNNNNNVVVNEGGGGDVIDGEGNVGDNDDSGRLNASEEMQDWGEDGGGVGGGDGAKVNSGGVVPKIGYSGFRQPFHSQFKVSYCNIGEIEMYICI